MSKQCQVIIQLKINDNEGENRFVSGLNCIRCCRKCYLALSITILLTYHLLRHRS